MPTPDNTATPSPAPSSSASPAATPPICETTPQSVMRHFLEQRVAQLDQQIAATALKLSQTQQQLAVYQGARAEATDTIAALDRQLAAAAAATIAPATPTPIPSSP